MSLSLDPLFALLDARWQELGVDAIVVLVQPYGAGDVVRVDLHSVVHPKKLEHEPSRKQKAGRHIKHVYFTSDELSASAGASASVGSRANDGGGTSAALTKLFTRLEDASLLFDDMHAQKPDPKHHEAVDKHPVLTNEVLRELSPNWTLVFGRPL